MDMVVIILYSAGRSFRGGTASQCQLQGGFPVELQMGSDECESSSSVIHGYLPPATLTVRAVRPTSQIKHLATAHARLPSPHRTSSFGFRVGGHRTEEGARGGERRIGRSGTGAPGGLFRRCPIRNPGSSQVRQSRVALSQPWPVAPVQSAHNIRGDALDLPAAPVHLIVPSLRSQPEPPARCFTPVR
jgi:hypothetical protein